MEWTASPSLVELARSGDREAFGEIVDGSFDAVYDFVVRLVRNLDDAEDVTQAAFVDAMTGLGGLRRAAGFDAWLLTFARDGALKRSLRAVHAHPGMDVGSDRETIPFSAVGGARFTAPHDSEAAKADAELVWQAAARLDLKQLSLLDLHLRQGLNEAEIAAVLGVANRNGSVVLTRLKQAAEDAICAEIVTAGGAHGCPGMEAVLAMRGSDRRHAGLKQSLRGHWSECAECGKRRRRMVPLATFSSLSPVTPPEGVKDRVREALMRQWPGAAAAPHGRSSGGLTDSPARTRSRPRARHFGGGSGFLAVGGVLAVAAAVLGVLMLFPASPIALTREDSPKVTLAAAGVAGAPKPGTPTAAASAIATSAGPPMTPTPAAVGAVDTATSAPAVPSTTATGAPQTPAPTTAVTATGTAQPVASATQFAATATPTVPAPTATATTPAQGCLGTFVDRLAITPGLSQPLYLNNFQCASAAFTITVGSGAPWLSASPMEGSISAGNDATIIVRVDGTKVPAASGTYTGSLIISGPNGQLFTITVTTVRGG